MFDTNACLDKVYLRCLEEHDFTNILRWHNDANLYTTLGGAFRYVSSVSESQWLRKRQEFSSQEISLAICLAENDEHIGNIYIKDIDWVARHGQVHIFIGDSAQQSKGYGQSALRQIIQHAFGDLALFRLYLYVLEDNAPAIHIYTKLGFVTEGCLRKHVFKNGVHKNLLIMGLINEKL